jgi:hypothetical protein
MKLGEAIKERDCLEDRFYTLGWRLLSDREKYVAQDPDHEKLVSGANRLRDLKVAISWTEHASLVGDFPLMAYRIRADINRSLAQTFEGIENEKADALYDMADDDEKIIEKAVWLIDLQVPTFSPEEEPEEEA